MHSLPFLTERRGEHISQLRIHLEPSYHTRELLSKRALLRASATSNGVMLMVTLLLIEVGRHRGSNTGLPCPWLDATLWSQRMLKNHILPFSLQLAMVQSPFFLFAPFPPKSTLPFETVKNRPLRISGNYHQQNRFTKFIFTSESLPGSITVSLLSRLNSLSIFL